MSALDAMETILWAARQYALSREDDADASNKEREETAGIWEALGICEALAVYENLRP